MAKKSKGFENDLEFDLEAYTQTLKIPKRDEKPPKYVVLSPELQACLGNLPGFALGDISEIWGDSDTGKSTILMKAAVEAQNQGILPVVIIKEKKHREARFTAMGFDTKKAIVNLSCANLEEMFEFMGKIIADVNKGKLQKDVMFFVDSFGNANCKAALKHNPDGTTETKNVHMQNAKVFSEEITTLADKINETRYETSPHYIGMVYVNHTYDKPVKIGGQTFVKEQPRGGKKRKYIASLEIKTKRIKSLKAIVNKIPLDFGFISKVTVVKNHINGVYTSGTLIITEDEIFANEPGAINDYKKRNKDKWGEAQVVAELVDGTSEEDDEDF